MNDAVRQALDASIENVLATMFFADAVPADGELELPPGSPAARVEFYGHPSGSLALRIAPDAAREITAAFLGIEETEASEEQIGETVRELANMICGSFVSSVESQTLIQLDAPTIHAEPAPPGGACLRQLQLDSGGLEVWLEWKGGEI